MRTFATVIASFFVVAECDATLITLDTAQHTLNIVVSPQLSRLTMQIQLFGFQPLTFSDIPISGTVPVGLDLDLNNSGTIEADNLLGGSLTFANIGQSFGSAFSNLGGTVQSIEVTAQLTMGTEVVVNRNVNIDRFTPGGLTLNGGTLRFTFTNGIAYGPITSGLGTNIYDVDLSIDPISFPFANLGTTIVSATADRDHNGFDSNGAEFNLPLTGLAVEQWLGTTRIVSSGNLYLGSNVMLPPIPELNSFGLVSLAAAGMAGAMAARRRAA